MFPAKKGKGTVKKGKEQTVAKGKAQSAEGAKSKETARTGVEAPAPVTGKRRRGALEPEKPGVRHSARLDHMYQKEGTPAQAKEGAAVEKEVEVEVVDEVESRPRKQAKTSKSALGM